MTFREFIQSRERTEFARFTSDFFLFLGLVIAVQVSHLKE